MNVEAHANALVNSVNRYHGSLADALANHEDGNSDLFYEAAEHIVEPLDIDDDYFEFLEEDTENWAQWIGNILGSDWGKIAKIVKEEGY